MKYTHEYVIMFACVFTYTVAFIHRGIEWGIL